MPEVTWTHPALPRILGAIPVEARSLIDVGCGRGIIGALARIYRRPTRLVGIDVYEPYLELCRGHRFYDECVQRALEDLPLPYGDGEFHVATCIEVIEHLPHPAGLKLLDELERIAKRVIVTTPGLFFEQTSFDDNPHQHHVSLWRAQDFRNRGYRVYGVGGMKAFGKEVRYISYALGPLTWPLPALSTLILCVRDMA